MSNIYEALEQAQRERSASDIPPLVSLPREEIDKTKSSVGKIPKSGSATIPAAVSIDEEMFCLCQNIDFLLPETPQKTIMFMGAQGEEGVSTIVREFARMAANRLGRTVLIMDAAHMNPTQHLHFNFKGGTGWKDAVKNGHPFEKACHGTGHPNIFLSPFSPCAAAQPYDHPAAMTFLEKLQKKFDFVLLDCSPATISPESIAMSRFADGVVLVMEADRTRSHVIENVRDKIVRTGGKVLGIVLNKRRYHIPDAIYRRL